MNTTAKQREYQSSLRRFMEHKDKCEYAKDESFTEEQLLAIHPSHIVAWFNLLAFGKEVPDVDDKPTGCRSNTLLNHKKRLSFFHPRKNHTWDPIREEGNPTRAQAVNEVISQIKVHEVRHTGSKSQARRPFDIDEFISLLAITDAITNNPEKSSRFRALATLQCQLIGRVSNMQKTQVSQARVGVFSFSSFYLYHLPFSLVLRQVSNFGWDNTALQALNVWLR